MVILWVLSCLVLLSGAFDCNTPTVNLARADSDCHCDVIAKKSNVIQLCDANVFRPDMQDTDENCRNYLAPPYLFGVSVKSFFEKICTILKDELCGSRSNTKFTLFQAGTVNGRVTPDCSPTNSEDSKDKKCISTRMHNFYGPNKELEPQQQAFRLLNNEECKLHWLSRIRNTFNCALHPDNYSCEDNIGRMLACEKNNNCTKVGFVYWLRYPHSASPLNIITRIIQFNFWD